MLASSPHLAEALQKVTTVAQISLLVPTAPAPDADPPQARAATGEGGGGAEGLVPPLAVLNTHLFFHPYAPHIRSMHTAAMLEEVAAAIEVRPQPAFLPPPRAQLWARCACARVPRVLSDVRCACCAWG
jgi:2',5'-phosphodiesterase